MKCCFIGLSKIENKAQVEEKVITVVENLINQGVDVFLFGGSSEFNDICFYILFNFKKKYPYIKLIDYYTIQNLLEENINFTKKIYISRNIEMINDSDICVFYYDKIYLPCRRKKEKRHLTSYQSNIVTKIAYEYAKNKKKIINIFNI